MNKHYALVEDTVLEKVDVDEYTNVDYKQKLQIDLPQMGRKPGEDWEEIENRMNALVESIDSCVFGPLATEKFEFVKMPEKYGDYQQMKHSEFYVCGGGFRSTISANFQGLTETKHGHNKMDDIAETDVYFRLADKFNKHHVGNLFGYWYMQREVVKNLHDYLKESCDKDNCIEVDKWLTSTGVRRRTKNAEKLNENQNLRWMKENKNGSRIIIVLDDDDNPIGEICWKTEDGINDKEYSEVYDCLERDGLIDIVSIKLKRIIPHGTPNGRPRKALVNVSIKFHINKLPTDYKESEEFANNLKSLRALAAIDYNRKCDILNGVISEDISCINDIMNHSSLLRNDLFFEIRLGMSNTSFLSGIQMNNSEMQEFWNIFMPLYTYYNNCLSQQDMETINNYIENSNCFNGKFFSYKVVQKEHITGDSLVRYYCTLEVYR